MQKTIVVVGGTGMLGQPVARHLKEAGFQVRIMTRDRQKAKKMFDDFLFPPEHQVSLAGGIPGAHLEIIERAGHEAPSERPAEIIRAVRDFMANTNAPERRLETR